MNDNSGPVVGDGHQSSAALADAITKMDRMKVDDDKEAMNSRSKIVINSLGAPTPVALLMDIRSSIEKMCKKFDEITDLVRENEIQRNNRELANREALNERESQISSLLVALTNKLHSSTPDRLMGSQGSSYASPLAAQSLVKHKTDYYYRNKKLSTNWDVLGCFFAQFDNLISDATEFDLTPDPFVVDITYWVQVCKEVSKAQSVCTAIKGSIDVPKVSNQEMSLCREVLGSTGVSTAARFTLESLDVLVEKCTTVMGIVEEIRCRIIRCQGIIGSSRMKRLLSVRYPYTTQTKELNTCAYELRRAGSKVLLDVVSSFKSKQKQREQYIVNVLEKDIMPMMAATNVANT